MLSRGSNSYYSCAFSISAATLGLCLPGIAAITSPGSCCGCVQILGSGLDSGYSDPAGSLVCPGREERVLIPHLDFLYCQLSNPLFFISCSKTQFTVVWEPDTAVTDCGVGATEQLLQSADVVCDSLILTLRRMSEILSDQPGSRRPRRAATASSSVSFSASLSRVHS